MKKIINPALLIDETGIKNINTTYICSVCKKKAFIEKVKKEKWYYRIFEDEENLIYLKKDNIGYVFKDKVEYICHDDMKDLSKEEAEKYVEVGLPYFLSIVSKTGGIFSF